MTGQVATEMDADVYQAFYLDNWHVSQQKTIEDCFSHQLGLRLAVEGSLIAFYRQDTGEKLPPPQELSAALARQTRIAEQERLRAEKAEQEIKRLHDRLLSLGIDP